MVRIAIENSSWNNIGDAFYQSSLTQSFCEIRPGAMIGEFDSPIERSFSPSVRAKPWYDARFDAAADIYILSGPILNRGFLPHYAEFIRSIRSRGGQFMLLSSFAKQDGSLDDILAFLRENPPLAFSSRDDPTFEACHTVSKRSFRGLCSAFYVSYLPLIPEIEPQQPYIISSFYTRPEARFEISADAAAVAEWSELNVDAPTWPAWKFSRHFQWLAQRQSEIQGYRIVRPVQDIASKFSHLNFPVTNRYLSYNPRCYLSVFKGTSLVVSDRVHACVAGLSFGKPARLVGKFDRAALLKVHDAVQLENGVMRADLQKIDQIRREFHTFIDEALASASL